MHGNIGLGDVVHRRMACFEDPQRPRGLRDDVACMDDAQRTRACLQPRRTRVVPHRLDLLLLAHGCCSLMAADRSWLLIAHGSTVDFCYAVGSLAGR